MAKFVVAGWQCSRFHPRVVTTFPSSIAFGCLLGAIATTVLAGPAEPAADKSGFHLFIPTPRALMRELSTDRPDQTESAYTVDAGHVQVEMDLVNFTYDRHSPDGTRTEVWNVAPVNLKIGLLNNVDLQLVLDNYVELRSRDAAGRIERASGFGDITARLKINLWGNDGGPTALALMPFVKLPLSESDLRNGDTEGGLIIPLAVALPGGWGLGVMTEVDFVRDGDGGRETEWLNSITVGRDLTDRIGAYLEFVAVVGTAPGFDWQGQVDLGFTFAATDDVQFDLGCNFGVTESAPDFQPFVGVTVRF